MTSLPPGIGPDHLLAAAVAEGALVGAVASLSRFANATRHYVYDVLLTDGRRAVVRLGAPDDRVAMRAAIQWNERLRPLGVPLPALLARDLTSEFPWLIWQRLRGSDLSDCFTQLSPPALGALAGHLALIQQVVGTSRSAGRYGWAAEPELARYTRWSDVLAQWLVEARDRIRDAHLGEEAAVDAVEQRFTRLAPRLDEVPATAFLPTVGLDNVIVSEDGQLAGLTHVDGLCWGDPRWAIAVTLVDLESRGWPPGFAEAWLALTGDRPDARFWFYTALACVRKIAAFGEPEAPAPYTIAERDRLNAMLTSLLTRLDAGLEEVGGFF